MLLTIKEALEYLEKRGLKISEKTLFRYRNMGLIKDRKFERFVRFEESELERFIGGGK